MKKQLTIALSVAIIAIVVISTPIAVQTFGVSSSNQIASKKPFYFGVTYCGNSTAQAEQLINQVKSYTNLFVIQSGPLEGNLSAVEQISSYAVNSGLYIIVYYGSDADERNTTDAFANFAQANFGNHFLGVYYGDEPGGKMLDITVELDNGTVVKSPDLVASLKVNSSTYDLTAFYSSGKITVTSLNFTSGTLGQLATTNYYSNGTISYQTGSTDLIYESNGTVQYSNGTIAINQGNITQFEPYQQLWDSRPLQTSSQAATAFVYTEQTALTTIGNQTDLNLFTSDYGLYWYDYLGGYNTVLAELSGNKTDAENIALVRGAADLQNKSWGVMVDWATQTAPYLQSSSQIYNDLQQAYESGAKYAVVFNYSPNGNGTGLLQSSDFAKLQQFWNNVVENPKVTNNVTGQDALVLPSANGFGLRSSTDNIWGLWPADNQSQQIWNAVQAALSKYGSKLDIVYDDPAYPTAGRYQHVFYWNQTI